MSAVTNPQDDTSPFADASGTTPPGDEPGATVVDIAMAIEARAAASRQQQADRARFGADFWQVVNGTRTFLSLTCAERIMDMGPLAVGIDERMWSYSGGVWTPDKDVIKRRAARLLGERYQSAHATNAGDHIKGQLIDDGRVIDGSPIKEVINFRNGYLDWATGELRDHDPELLSTTQLATDWDPTATCPEFDKFLADVLPADMIETAWELIGYLMYSGNPLHKAVMLHGTGRNGKSVFVNVVKRMLGEENVSGASLQDLAEERFAPAVLFGKLANICGDIDGSYMEKTAKFKAITGEDLMDAEYKGRDRFQFTNWAVPLFSANKIPGSADVTTGYLARWVVIPFPNSFEGREDRGLTGRISTPEEIRGIAARAVPALRNLLARGNFPETDSSREATEEFRRKVDQVRTWLDDRAEWDTTGEQDFPKVARTAVFRNYVAWTETNRYTACKSGEFYDRLKSIGIKGSKIKGEHYLKDLRLLDPFS